MTKKKILVFVTVLTMAFTSFAFTACGNEEPVNIGISYMDAEAMGEDLQAYVDVVEQAGAVPVVLPLVTTEDEAEAAIEDIDALIVTGGEDIDPAYYGQQPADTLETVNVDRDKSDMLVLEEALDEDMPILLTCRGLQMLNVYQGGTLYQDLPTMYDSDIQHRDPAEYDFTYHEITITEDSLLAGIVGGTTLEVNSWHHQGVDKLGQGLKVTATTADGLVEGIEMIDKTFVVAVQFHPEWNVIEHDGAQMEFFTELIEQAEVYRTAD